MAIYTVRSGDTLWKIAKKFVVPLDAIVQLNSIPNPDKIQVGQRLVIPENTTDGMDDVAPQPEESPTLNKVESRPRINRKRFPLPQKEYFPIAVKKDLIVLHFTAGRTVNSAYYHWLNQPSRVATAYGVNPSGAIYEHFDPAHWAFHLGVKGTQGRHDKRSIGIEIANVGPLKLSSNKPNQLNWWPRNWGARYCRVTQTSKYLKHHYRGIDFFAVMPKKQVKAVVKLVHYLCDRFEIPKRLPPLSRRTDCDIAYFSKFKGIAGHQNFRKDKWDVGPAFNWDEIGF